MLKEVQERILLSGARFLAQKEFWIRKLSGNIVETSLFLGNRLHKIKGNICLEKLEITLSSNLCQWLEKISKNSDLSIYLILLTTLETLIYRYTLSDDITVISPVCKLNASAETINDFVFMRSWITGDMTFKELLLKNKASVAEVYNHQDYPLRRLIKELFPGPAEGDEQILTRIECSLDNIHKKIQRPSISGKISFHFNKKEARINGYILYDSSAYDEHFIRQISNHFVNILVKGAGEVNTKIADFQFLTDWEKRCLLIEFNDNKEETFGDKTILHLIEKQSGDTSDRVAVGIEEKRLTYFWINKTASQWANFLRNRGIQKEKLVGILLNRSPLMVVSILAVWKAGGAYIPIDPKYPEKRIVEISKDSKAEILLTQSRYITPGLEKVCETKLIEIDKIPRAKGTGGLDAGEQEFRGNSLAYIIYTSGSTGKPSGAMVEHMGMLNHIQAKICDLGVTEKSIIAQNSSHTFDISLWQFFTALTLGGETQIYPHQLVMVPQRFITRLIKDQVTILEVVPSYLLVLLEHLEEGSVLPLAIEYLVVTGETIKPLLVKKWFDRYPHIKMVNAYGPTEASDDITHYIMNSTLDLECMEHIPIGRPLQNLNIYIVDNNMQLCPIGVRGEICVSGIGVGRGYFNNPEKTAAKFIDILEQLKRFSTSHWPTNLLIHKTIYRTGDLGCWLPDGTINFFGRKDNQIKIRGYRIEPGEIENRLMNHEKIKEVVVIDRADNEGNKYLCAYTVLLDIHKPLTLMEIQKFLAKDLPEYMIPSHFIWLEKIPLTPNGKVDRKALPEPGIEQGKKFAAPRDKVEEKLQLIWSMLLGIDKENIGIDDDFFQLGGHSLKVTLLVSRIHREMKVKLALADIFDRPTIRALSGYINESSPTCCATLEPVEDKEYFRLSSAQKRLFILQQMNPLHTAYNMPGIVYLEKDLEIDKLEKAIEQLIERHESFRVAFEIQGDEPVQRVYKSVEFKIKYYEKGLLKDQEFTNANCLLPADFVRPFDLGRPPLVRIGLLSTGENNILLVDIHHIISDAVSEQIIEEELIEIYNGKELPGLRLQYRDFAEWQNTPIQREIIREQEEYWLREFSYSAELPVLDLPTDYPRPAVQSFEGNSLDFQLNSGESQALIDLAAEIGATLYMVILSIFTILLSRLSGQEDIIIGTPIAGRRHPDLEKIIGMFVNTVAIRNFPWGDKTFIHFLMEVKERVLKAYENQDYPFEDLVEKLDLPRDTGANPVFDVLFNLLEQRDKKVFFENNQEGKYKSTTAKFDLNLRAIVYGERIQFNLEYCTGLYKKETIERIIGYFKQVVTDVIANPNGKILDIEIISKEAAKEMLDYFNEDLKGSPGIIPIQVRLHRSVLGYKDNISIQYGNNQITYFELESRAVHIMNRIRNNGIKNGSFIGIYIADKIEIISTIIGILNAGCVFIILDTRFPIIRISEMILTVDIRTIFTDANNESLLNNLQESHSYIGEIFPVDTLTELSSAHGKNRALEFNYSGEDSVYVYFSSGSSGQPKAIVGKNESLSQFIQWEIEVFFVDETYRISQLAAASFDAFLRNVFTPLCAGGTVCIPEFPEVVMDSQLLVEWIDRSTLTFIHCVPSLFRLIIGEYLTSARFRALKYVVMSGEFINPVELKKWHGIFGYRIQLVNCYGATETTVIKMFHFIRADDLERVRIPAGFPMKGARVLVLNRYMKVCTVGISGEIFVRTPYGTYGYLNDPELTVRRFIKNPFPSNNKERIYKTGDLGRFLANGSLEILGRLDRQVKIRGIRIEPGEIETRLLGFEGVCEAVVATARDEQGNNYLCAYIVADGAGRDKSPLDVTKIRNWLSRYVPGYMIPSYFVELVSIPKTASGKIHQKSLPEPSFATDKDYIAPRDELERKLVRIWSKILKVNCKAIGIHTNFFEVGGHSLKATLLVSRLDKELHVKIPLLEVFKRPTIAGLSQYVKSAVQYKYARIEPTEKKDYYELSSAQKRLYILHQMNPQSTGYNMPETTSMEKDLDKDRLEEAFRKIIKRHESLRTSFHLVDEQPVQRIHENIEFEIEYYEVGGLQDEKLTSTANFLRPFDLSKVPLLRARLIAVPDKTILMVDMHHIISDGTSHNVLVEEFTALFEGKRLLGLRLQYRDYSWWQNSAEQKKVISRQEAYWLNRFRDSISVLRIPMDFERQSVQALEGNELRFKIGVKETTALKKICSNEGVTIYMLILAVYNVLLSKLGGQEDIAVGTVISGRNHVDLEKIIGMFVNVLVMRNFPGGEKSFTEFLAEIKLTTIDAFENQNYHIENLVDKVIVRRDISRNPLYDVGFTLQNFFSHPTQVQEENILGENSLDNETEVWPGKPLISKLDLNLVGFDMGEWLFFKFEYCSKLFKEETIRRFIKYFKTIISTIIENRRTKLKGIEIMSTGDVLLIRSEIQKSWKSLPDQLNFSF